MASEGKKKRNSAPSTRRDEKYGLSRAAATGSTFNNEMKYEREKDNSSRRDSSPRSPASTKADPPAATQRQEYDNYLVDSEMWINKGADFARKGFHKEALACFENAIKSNPNNAKAWYNKGTCLSMLGIFNEESLRCFDMCIGINPLDAGAWTNRGTTMFQMGNYEEAIRSYNRALEIHPVHSSAWENKGILYNFLGMREEAIRCFKKAKAK